MTSLTRCSRCGFARRGMASRPCTAASRASASGLRSASAKEGHFFESVAPTALEKTIAENRKHIRCLFHHGQDPMCGVKPLGPILSLEADTSYEVELLEADYVRALIPGIAANQYGVSFGFHVVKDDVTMHPRRSDWNPSGISQVTIREARLQEFGPTPFPADKGANVAVRSELCVSSRMSSEALPTCWDHASAWLREPSLGNGHHPA
jgi:phage head maturation protease